MTTAQLFAIAGAGIVAIGFYAQLARHNLIRKILGLNLMGSGVFLILVSLAGRGETPDSVPQAMVLTGLVVSVSATALALALVRRLHRESGRLDWVMPTPPPPELMSEDEESDDDSH